MHVGQFLGAAHGDRHRRVGRGRRDPLANPFRVLADQETERLAKGGEIVDLTWDDANIEYRPIVDQRRLVSPEDRSPHRDNPFTNQDVARVERVLNDGRLPVDLPFGTDADQIDLADRLEDGVVFQRPFQGDRSGGIGAVNDGHRIGFDGDGVRLKLGPDGLELLLGHRRIGECEGDTGEAALFQPASELFERSLGGQQRVLLDRQLALTVVGGVFGLIDRLGRKFGLRHQGPVGQEPGTDKDDQADHRGDDSPQGTPVGVNVLVWFHVISRLPGWQFRTDSAVDRNG